MIPFPSLPTTLPPPPQRVYGRAYADVTIKIFLAMGLRSRALRAT